MTTRFIKTTLPALLALNLIASGAIGYYLISSPTTPALPTGPAATAESILTSWELHPDAPTAVGELAAAGLPDRFAPTTTMLFERKPEPTIWGMLVVGLGMVGVDIRRRKRMLAKQ